MRGDKLHALRTSKPLEDIMNVILTSMCCGKTSLEKHNTQFFDFDIFANVKTSRQIAVVRQMISDYAENCDDRMVYLFNMDRFYKFGLNTVPFIKVIEAAVPEASAFDYFLNLYKDRELKENGGVRERAYNCFKKSLVFNLEKARELEAKDVKVHYLKHGENIKYLLKDA